jgi:hypothetical protein
MATTSLAKQVQELRRLFEVRGAVDAVYCREAPEGVPPERVILVKRVFIDPPVQPQEQLPEVVEPSPAIERASPPPFNRPLAEPELGVV